ncbi:hypothetical protein ILUMI_12562 [Ignelater luminosus]|uniref:DDE Tnp4 domain-containing protein n=1 Tax=Ignelater luminosus TaxID=2038154 RepID=A0A8K0G6N4_IGNLU|nr:hypothetical protein ILUMI_12562 [Ignelater luminosus]
MLNNKLLSEDPVCYRNYLRMSSFENLLQRVENNIAKIDTFMRDSISARSRLEVTLRFLATGETYRSLMYDTRIHESTISRFVPEVCQAIYNILKNTYFKMPTSENDWEKVAEQFYLKWDFPNCLEALDRRHIKFRPPHSSGSYFFNYKGNHSIVLLGLCGGVFRESFLSQAIANNSVNFPPAKALPGRSLKVPYVVVQMMLFHSPREY